MIRLRTFALIHFLCLACLYSVLAQQTASHTDIYAVYFSPRGCATDAIVRTINNAKESILVQAYSFTSETIADALIRAHKKGVRVQVLLDKSQQHQKYSCIDVLAAAKVPLLVDAFHAIAHNKVMIIDNEILITGSFNFTKAAEERNAENLLILQSHQLADQYIRNWRLHRRHSMRIN
jgi:phosphatidylserine/phosphatidylglycerophosphate/cardiolipin synthase-like enzyme